MLTLNADEHPLMSRMHKPDPKLGPDAQDKRSVVPVEFEDVDAWLHGTQEQSQALARLAPAKAFDAWTGRQMKGFTLIELMVVVAVIAILALLAVPSMQNRLVREQIVEAVRLADIAKAPIATSWTLDHALPLDNAGAGLPVAEKIVSNHVKSLTIEGGAIHLTFGNQATAAINGKTLTLRPAIVEDAPVVPVAWVCGNARPPDQMTVQGTNRTDVERNFLPLNCRAG